jgi:hypothetical protein
MASNLELENRIQAYDWPMLRSFWDEIKNNNTANLTPSWASGKAFEYFIIRCFELSGCEVVYAFDVTNRQAGIKNNNKSFQQIDGIVYLTINFPFVIEAKNEAGNAKEADIDKLIGRLGQRPPQTMGCFFDTKGYSDGVLFQLLSKPNKNLLLWEKLDIDFLFSDANFQNNQPIINIADILRAKWKFFVERMNPYYIMQ